MSKKKENKRKEKINMLHKRVEELKSMNPDRILTFSAFLEQLKNRYIQ